MLVEKLPDAPDESVSERAVPQQVEVSDQGQAVEDVEESTETAERAAENAEEKVADVPETEWVEEQLNPIHQQLSALQEASLQSQDLVDELHEQVGKLVVTSRRDLMRMKKRLDELEQSGTSQSVPDNTEQVNEIVSELQQQLETLGGRFDQFMGERGDSVKGMEGDVWLPRLNQLEEAMAHLEQRHDRLEQQQAALLDQQLTQLEERIVRLESSPERDQAVKGVSPTEDGRVSSIAEELRYEIAEVKKRSLRDIETINSKVGTLATSGDVQQIVRQAVALLENRIEGIEKQQKSTPMNSASIRF